MESKAEKVANDMETKAKKKTTVKEFFKEQKKTLPLKIVILCFSGGAICLMPFIVLQMRSIGLTINEIAAIYLVVPIGSILGPVISGLIADKIGRYKLVFVCNVIIGTISCNLLLVTPHFKSSKIYLNCEEGQMSIVYNDCNECIKNLQIDIKSLNLKNCITCVEDEYYESNCTGEHLTAYTCPVFNTTNELQQITVDVLPSENSSSVCNIKVENVNQANMSFVESKQKCYRTKTCDYTCDIPDELKECFPNPLMSDTFIYTGIIIFAGHFFIAACFTMLDATILQIVKEQNISIGKQKIMNVIGFGLTPLLAGLLIDIHSKSVGHQSYFAVFMLSNALMGITVLLTYFVNMTVDRNNSNILRDLRKLVTSLEVDFFLFLVLILGCNYGFIESYTFIYLQSLGAPSFLLGLTMTVGCLSSIPMLFCADWIDKMFGRHIIFVICFTAYATRMVGYSLIRNPWMSLIFECLESITYHLMWVTCLKLCPLLAPKGLLATMTGLAGSIQYSLGKGIGGFVGGHLISRFGMRNAFRIFGGVALCGGVFYIIIHYAYFKKKFEEKERELAEAEETEKEELGKKMFMHNGDKCPSCNELLSMELHHSFLALAGPTRKSSVDEVIFYRSKSRRRTSERKSSKELTQEHRNLLNQISKLSRSVPYLYNAELYDNFNRSDEKKMFKSDNNLKI